MTPFASFRLGWSVGALVLSLALLGAGGAQAQEKKDSPPPKTAGQTPKAGLIFNDPKAFHGYTIMSPLRSKTTYLLDMNGKVAHSWTGAANPALVPFLLENGNLLRMTEALGSEKKFKGIGPGQGGRIQEITWDGEIVWDFIYNSVDEIVPPVDAQGRYSLKTGSAYGPEQAVWSYTAPKKSDFFSNFISGAQRLPNGNTLICAGASGTLFEVTPDKEIVWKYVNPVRDAPAKGKGPPKGPGDARPGQVLAASTQGVLKLSDDQKKQVLDLQKDVAEQLDRILTEPQNKELASLKPGPPGFGDPPLPGQILPAFVQGKLKLADDQKTRVAALQQETDGKLGAILADEQRKLLKTMLAGPPGFPAGGGGGQSAANVFRVYRFAPTYPGLKGRDLTATKTVEELLSKEAKGK